MDSSRRRSFRGGFAGLSNQAHRLADYYMWKSGKDDLVEMMSIPGEDYPQKICFTVWWTVCGVIGDSIEIQTLGRNLKECELAICELISS